jgi:hypothetical protein
MIITCEQKSFIFLTIFSLDRPNVVSDFIAAHALIECDQLQVGGNARLESLEAFHAWSDLRPILCIMT